MERIQVADVAQIYALCKEYSASVSAGDMERWMALWIEEGIQMPPGAPRRVGKTLIRAEMQPLLDRFDWQMAIQPDEVQVLGDQAYAHGFYNFVLMPKEGGDAIEANGKFLTILHKQVDGSWKIAIDCFNYDAPLN